MNEIIANLENISFPHYHMVPKDIDQNIKFRLELMKMVQTDPLAGVQIKKMCAEDMLFHINAMCFTYSPKDSVTGYPVTQFITYEFQDEAMAETADCIISGRDVAVPKSRGMGASWMGLAILEWFWHFKDFQSFLITSRKQELVDNRGDPVALFSKIDFLHEHMPDWLLPTGRRLGDKDPNRKMLHLKNADNDSVIDGESTTENIGVGDRRTALFLDEFAALPTNDGYAVVRGSRDVTNCRIFNSTPRGRNAFHDIVFDTSAKVVRLHWSRHPLFNKGLYTSKNGKLILLDKEFREVVEVGAKGEKEPKKYQFPEDYPFILDDEMRSPWYDNECSRGVTMAEIKQELDIDFLGSDYQFFDPQVIEKLIKQYCRAPSLVGDLEYDPTTLEPKRFTMSSKGKLSLWMNLDGGDRVDPKRNFVVGSDVSAGTGASNSVSSFVDRDTGEKVAVWRDPNTQPNEFADMSFALAKFFNNAFMIWDGTGPTGKSFRMQVGRREYDNIYYRRNEKKIGLNVSDEPGCFLQPEMKASTLGDYRADLAAHKFVNPSDYGMKETLQFVVRPGGTVEHSGAANSQDPSGAKTAHGDEVIADALANKGLEEDAVSRPEDDDFEPPAGSLAWRRKQAECGSVAESNSELDGDWS